MNTNLEDHLRRLTDPVAAPPTDRAREAITHRKQVLHRRHQTRRAVGVGTLVAIVVAGILVLRGGPTGTVDTGLADGGDDDLVALAVDGKGGWEVAQAYESTGTPAFVAHGRDMSVQVFQRAGEPDGPTIFLQQTFPTDTNVYDAWSDVAIGEFTGHLLKTGTNDYRLEWQRGDDLVSIYSRGVGEDEVLTFARELDARETDYGAQPDIHGTLGFDPAYVPAGLSEQSARKSKQVLNRFVDGRPPGGELGSWWTISILERGPYGFETVQEQGLVAPDAGVAQVRIAGRQATLYDESRTKGTWTLVMPIGDDLQAQVTLAGDAAMATELGKHLKLLTRAEWERLVDEHSSVPPVGDDSEVRTDLGDDERIGAKVDAPVGDPKR